MDCSLDPLSPLTFSTLLCAPAEISGRRVFLVQDPKRPEDPKAILSTLQAVLKTLQDTLPELNGVFQKLHQRSAQLNKVVATHTALSATVKELKAKVEIAAHSLYEYIPLIPDQRDQVAGLRCMFQIEAVKDYALLLANDLTAILDSPSHQEALEYYKKQIEKCDTVASLKDFNEKMITIEAVSQAILRDTLNLRFGARESSIATEEATKLYDEALDYTYYVTEALERSCTEDHVKKLLQLRIQSVKSNITNRLGPGRKPYSRQEPAISKTAIVYLTDNETENIVLPTLNYFRNGQWGVFAAYRKISTQYTALQTIAKALYRMQQDLEMSLLDIQAQRVDLKTIYVVLIGLKQHIINEIINLTTLELSTHVHAGWYYAGGLLAQVGHIQKLIRRLDERTFLHAKAVSVLTAGTTTIEDLWTQVQAACNITNPGSLYSPISQTIARRGAILLSLAPDEAVVPKLVFTRETTWTFFPLSIQNYLQKGFLRNLHFTMQEIDPEFEAVLYILKYDSAFSKGFERCLQQNPVIKELHEAYGRSHDPSIFDKISDFMFTLHQVPPHEALRKLKLADSYVRYHKLAESLKSFPQMEKKRLRWLQKALEKFRTSNHEAFTHAPLIPKLTDSAFGKNDIDAIMEIPEVDESLTGITKVLFQRCLLDHLMNDPDKLQEKHIYYLEVLFTEYIEDNDARDIWRNQYDVGFMEIALQRFLAKTQSAILRDKLASIRGAHAPMWNEVVEHLIEFRKHVTAGQLLTPHTEPYNRAKAIYAKVKSLVNQASFHDLYKPTTYETIAALLACEMAEFLHASRRYFRKD